MPEMAKKSPECTIFDKTKPTNQDKSIFFNVAQRHHDGSKFKWIDVVNELNSKYNCNFTNNEYNRKRIKKLAEKEAELRKVSLIPVRISEENNINDISYANMMNDNDDIKSDDNVKIDSIHISPTNMGVNRNKNKIGYNDKEKYYYETFLGKIKRSYDENSIKDILLKKYNDKNLMNVKPPRKMVINKFTAPAWAIVDSILEDLMPLSETIDDFLKGKRLIRAAAETIKQITTIDFERKEKKRIRRLKKIIVKLSGEIELLKNVKTKPCAKASQLLAQLRLRYPKRSNYKIKEYITFLTWMKEEKQKEVNRLKVNEHRRILRLAFSKSPSLKLIDRLSGNTTKFDSPLNIDEVHKYYTELYSEKTVKCDGYEKFLKENFLIDNQVEVDSNTLTEDINFAIDTISPWKTPGIDGIAGAFYKNLKSVREWTIKMIYTIITKKITLPDVEYEGKAVLLYKSNNPEEIKNYRPITLLNVFYKITTSTINAQVMRYCYHLIPKFQFANKKQWWSTCMAKYIDATITKDYETKGSRLYCAWIDYQKAYDSITSHSISSMISSLPIAEEIKYFLLNAQKRWKVRYVVNNKLSKKVSIRSGILQGDSISPTIFVLVSSYITYMLDKQPKIELKIGRSNLKVKELENFTNYLCFMDDLKCFATSMSQLNTLLSVIRSAAGEIGLQLNEKKCGITTNKSSIECYETNIPFIDDSQDPYKYLGIKQRFFDDSTETLQSLEKKLIDKTKAIWDYDLNVGNIITLHNLIIPAAASYITTHLGQNGKLMTTFSYIGSIDSEIVKIFRNKKLLQSNNCTGRLFMDVKKGGLEIKNLRVECMKNTACSIVYCLMKRELASFTFTQLALYKKQRRNKIDDLRSIIQRFTNNEVKIEIDLEKFCKVNHEIDAEIPITLKLDDVKLKFHTHKEFQKYLKKLIDEKYQEELWDHFSKSMYYPKWLEEISKNDEVLHLYINSGMSIKNTKILLAAQEDQLMLKGHPANKSKDKSCRTCGDPLETPRHILNYCPTYMSSLQVRRHNRVMHIVGRFLAKKYKVEYAKIGENNNCKYTIDTPWPVDEKLHHHLPDIVWMDKVKRKIYVIEISIPHWLNYQNQIELKNVRYCVNSLDKVDMNYKDVNPGKNYCEVLANQEKMSTVFICLAISSTGEILKSVKDNFESHFGKGGRLWHQLSRAAVLGSTRIIKWHFATSHSN